MNSNLNACAAVVLLLFCVTLVPSCLGREDSDSIVSMVDNQECTHHEIRCEGSSRCYAMVIETVRMVPMRLGRIV